MTSRARSAVLALQVAAIAGLFAGSVLAIWRAGAVFVARDRVRAETLRKLAKVDDALAVAGAPGLTQIPDWPGTLEPEEWAALDGWLAEQASQVLVKSPGHGGGYYVPAIDRYLGHAGGTVATIAPTRRRARAGLPPPQSDLIDDQVLESLDRDRPVERVVESPSEAFALRASPLYVNGRRVAAIWVMARLDEPSAVGSSVRSYQWASGLALGGLALALLVAVTLAVSIRRHVADRERLQGEMRRAERLAALGAMLAGVSHEMRNPLAGIRSAAQLWQRGLVNNSDLSSELIGEVDRLDAIVGNLLRFSRAEPRAMEPGDVNAVVAEAARLCRAGAEGIAVAQDLAPSARVAALDPSTFLQVLRNLSANAVDAVDSGGTIQLSTRCDHVSQTVRVTVRDDGPGLSDEALAHLFEPFHTTKPHGTGLGLAIAREIVLAHGGDDRGPGTARRAARSSS